MAPAFLVPVVEAGVPEEEAPVVAVAVAVAVPVPVPVPVSVAVGWLPVGDAAADSLSTPAVITTGTKSWLYETKTC
jgi:hypothetical protein